MLGMAGTAQVVLGEGKRGGWTQVNIAWSMAVTFGIITGFPLSHGHINPSWSLVRCCQGHHILFADKAALRVVVFEGSCPGPCSRSTWAGS